jgi:ribosome-associated protein
MEAERVPRLESEGLARRLAAIADAKQATDIVVLDMRELVGYTDFLVLATARNERLAKAIADDARMQLKAEGLLPGRAEGEREARWILLDYLDAVLHVFVPETRELYRLEQLWGEAPRLELELAGPSG